MLRFRTHRSFSVRAMSAPKPSSSEPYQDAKVISHTLNVLESFRRKVGRPLHPSLEGLDDSKLAAAAYKGPFVLVSHGTEADPIFNYCNKTAQRLWELEWSQFCGMPSRKSAEAVTGIQSDRNSALAKALEKGYFDGYEGWRVSSTGRRFLIKDAILWNVEGPTGARLGQAATFTSWEFEDGRLRGPGVVPSQADVAEASAAVELQAQEVRKLKEAEGLGNQDPRVVAAVAELSARKEERADLERRWIEAQAIAGKGSAA